MTTSLIEAESVLAIDLGSIHTRAMLFDVVDGHYRFIGSGSAPSSANAPFRDVSEGVFNAITNLQEKLGRTLARDGRLILPGQSDGSGVDRLVLVYTAGPELRIVSAGLLPDVSLQSAAHLASTIPCQIVESIGLADRRRMDMQIDAVLKATPDLIIFSGGTEQGASRSVVKLAELLLMVCRIIPAEIRPHILYAGNSALAKRLQDGLSKCTTVHVSPNLRPTIDSEDLGQAQQALGELLTGFRSQQLGGMGALTAQCSAVPMPGSHALGRMVQFLSQVYDPNKGVLGLDLGSRHTTIAFAQKGRLNLNVSPFGLGSTIRRLLNSVELTEITRWLTTTISDADLRDTIFQKSLHPADIPLTLETLDIEQAIAKAAISLAFRQAMDSRLDNCESFEPILACGSILGSAPTAGQSLLMLLDGLQPVGISTIILDKNALLPALGAAAGFNPILPIQVLESSAFLHLGTVICPVSRARPGTVILRVRLEYEKGNESRMEIRQGSLTMLPLQHGQAAYLHIEPLRHTLVDPCNRRGMTSIKVVGGMCGAVIDARGRPFNLPVDHDKRRELLGKWRQALGG